MDDVKALVFDVFGTVVDWRNSITKHAAAFGEAQGIEADWAAFRRRLARQVPAVHEQGANRRTALDQAGRAAPDGVGGAAGRVRDQRRWASTLLTNSPWPGTTWTRGPTLPAGLSRLKAKYIIGTMSNGNVALMTNMAKYAGLPWDVILGAELAQAYKPDPKTYLTGVELLGLYPEQVMMVAAHQNDLLAAGRGGPQDRLRAAPHGVRPRPQAGPDARPVLRHRGHRLSRPGVTDGGIGIALETEDRPDNRGLDYTRHAETALREREHS